MSAPKASLAAEISRDSAAANKELPRRRTRKKLRIVLLALFLLIVAVALAGIWFVRRPWPQVSGVIHAVGLQAPVEVIRDRWAMPHIFAQNPHDLFFSQGYVHAQDRMWQLEFTRRIGNGSLCEILGPDAIEIDRLTRTLGMRRVAEADWAEMKGEDREALTAYAEGINSFLSANRGRLALEFRIFGVDPEPWSPLDSLVIVKLISWSLSENASIEVSRARIIGRAQESVAKQLLPPYSEGAPVIIPQELGSFKWLNKDLLTALKSTAGALGTAGPTQGSNNWIVSGKRTANGHPLLANDTHLDLFIPSIYYAIGLEGGGFHVAGYSLAGTPGVPIGHNEHIAWGITDLVADVEDMYVEKLDSDSEPARYEFRGEWLPLKIDTEVVKVKGAEPITLRVASTNHGPIVNQFIDRFKDSRPLSIAWSGEHNPGLIESILLLNRSADWNEFRRALSFWDGPNINFGYADVDGNIGYQAAGRIPIRGSNDPGIMPVPGWTGEYEWKGLIPFDGLPNSFNPSRGFIVSANQKPVSADYPYPLGYEFADPFRAARLNDLLSVNNHVSIEDSEKMQGDTFHIAAEQLVPYLLAIKPADDVEAKTLDEIKAWDLRCDPDQVGAAIYQVWYRFLVQETVADELGPELTDEYMEFYWIHCPVMLNLVRDNNSRLFDDTRTPEIETRDDIAKRSFKDAVQWLTSHCGPNPHGWKWGRIHTLRFHHRPFGMVDVPVLSKLFNYGPIPAPGGDRFTLNATWFTWDDPDNPYKADGGTAQRIIIDLADWDRCVGVNSTGQVEHLFHPHRDDEITRWRELKYHPLAFSRKAIEEQKDSLLTITP